MHFGISLPNFDLCSDPRTAVQLAHIAEESGWDGFFLWDHVLWTWPHVMPVSDPFMLLASMAMSTSRIRLGALITPLPRRRPWTLARQLITLDHISGGRAVAGFGLGGDWFGDYSKFGEPTSDQKVLGEMLDEGLEVIAGLWSGEPFSFEGKHYRISDVQYLPKPIQEPRIPVWLAGTWPNKKPFRRAARWDGICPLIANEDRELTPQEIADAVSYIGQFRDGDAPFDVTGTAGDLTQAHPDAGKDRERVDALEEVGVTWCIAGGWPPMDLDIVRANIEKGPPRT